MVVMFALLLHPAAAAGSSATALHAAMVALEAAVDATDAPLAGTGASTTCPVAAEADAGPEGYTRLLAGGQAALAAGHYLASRTCYLTALHRYWRDYNAAAAIRLSASLSRDVAAAAADTARVTGTLEQLAAAASSGSGSGRVYRDAAPAVQRAALPPQRQVEPEVNRAPGPHAAPPGAALLSQPEDAARPVLFSRELLTPGRDRRAAAAAGSGGGAAAAAALQPASDARLRQQQEVAPPPLEASLAALPPVERMHELARLALAHAERVRHDWSRDLQQAAAGGVGA